VLLVVMEVGIAILISVLEHAQLDTTALLDQRQQLKTYALLGHTAWQVLVPAYIALLEDMDQLKA